MTALCYGLKLLGAICILPYVNWSFNSTIIRVPCVHLILHRGLSSSYAVILCNDHVFFILRHVIVAFSCDQSSLLYVVVSFNSTISSLRYTIRPLYYFIIILFHHYTISSLYYFIIILFHH